MVWSKGLRPKSFQEKCHMIQTNLRVSKRGSKTNITQRNELHDQSNFKGGMKREGRSIPFAPIALHLVNGRPVSLWLLFSILTTWSNCHLWTFPLCSTTNCSKESFNFFHAKHAKVDSHAAAKFLT